MEQGRALANPAGGGGVGAETLLACLVVSRPVTVSTWPATAAGTLSAPEGACTVWPSWVKRWTDVPNAACAAATVPRTDRYWWAGSTPVTFSPDEASHDDTELTSAFVGAHVALYWARVMKCR